MNQEKRWSDDDFKSMILAEIQAAKQSAITDIRETNYEIRLQERDFYRNLKEILESVCGFIKIESMEEYRQDRRYSGIGRLDDHVNEEKLHGIFLDNSMLQDAIRKHMDQYREEIGRQYLPTAEAVQEKLDDLVKDIQKQREQFNSMKWRFLLPFSSILSAGIILAVFLFFLIRNL